MIGRVAWRVVLPVVNLLLFVALVAWGSQPVLHGALIQGGVAPDGSYSLTFENPYTLCCLWPGASQLR